jgi:putative phosphoesterase
MRIGLISDVHANLVALEAVLDDMPPVDEVLCAGDVVGYNPWPAECVDRVREVASVTVRGNHDRTVEEPGRYRANRMAHAGLRLARDRCSDDQLAWLRDLPERATRLDDRLLVVHSHPDPASRGTYVYPEAFPRMRPHLDDRDVLVLGHTHVQHAATVDGRLIVNPGSVGQPRDRDPDAAYAVLDAVVDGGDGEAGIDVEASTLSLRRVAYDVERVRAAVEEAGLPDRTGERLASGR